MLDNLLLPIDTETREIATVPVSGSETITGKIIGGGDLPRKRGGGMFVEIHLARDPKCLQIGAPVSVVMLTDDYRKAEGR